MQKRGQVTLFILIGIAIVAIIVALFFLFPRIQTTFSFSEENPSDYIKSCVEERLVEGLDLVSKQGGSINPEHYILYQGEKLEYLCYTNEYYITCVMQQPLLYQHIQSELEDYIEDVSAQCFEDLKESHERKGHSFELDKGDYYIELLPNKVQVVYDYNMTIDDGEVKNYDNLVMAYNNNIYELVSIATSILNFEAHYGDAETTFYMNYYKDLKVEKKKQSDGSTIYVLTEVDTGNKFQFASRSLAWPPGYQW